MGVILTVMMVVGISYGQHTERTSVAISHQRFNSMEACKAAGELAKLHASQLTPDASTEPSNWGAGGKGARVVFFCAAEG